MKKILILIGLLFLFPLVSAVSIEINEEYSQGETLLAEISGNFVNSFSKDNIVFYKRHMDIPINFEVSKIENKYYVYASLLGKTPDNYSISLENIKYVKAGKTLEEDISKAFIITNKTADFTITPGFVITNDDFSVNVYNLQDSEITVDISIDPETIEEGLFASLLEEDSGESLSSIDILSDQTKKINFNVGDINESKIRTIEFKSENTRYNFPAYVYTNETKTKEKKESYRFEPKELNLSMATDSSKNIIFYLYNNGDFDLEDIDLEISSSLDPYVSLSIEEIDKLEEGESVKLELFLDSSENAGIFEGDIKAKTNESLYTYLDLTLNFVKDYVPLEEDELNITDPAKTQTCEEVSGTICKEDEKCSEPTIYLDDNCCLATCEKPDSGSSGKIIGWSIVIAVIVFVLWFLKNKYSRTRRNFNLLNIAKGRRY